MAKTHLMFLFYLFYQLRVRRIEWLTLMDSELPYPLMVFAVAPFILDLGVRIEITVCNDV
ncbi:hypothetical protein LIPSTDRAFT_75255 [Lipomyces starkeyi NRRL Y-11557]|uniref:Uncharacterized protein n=1 Tax=Lipomyces starkeyi NRRL Y-11557 TaxID=675824 RepID=A0A1E3PXS3_LIPST|nr:hypothetical protein LIPSTDRAFT_75255 [Lipomyces starkeyi NRRL Y-11557]